MDICSMPECQTTAGCMCRRSGIIYTPPFMPSPADSYYNQLISQLTDTITDLRARCASLEADRDGLAKALETLRDGYGPNHLSRYVRTVASKALAAYRKDATHE